MRPRLEVRVFASISTLGAGRASLRPMARLCSSGGFTRWPCDTGASTSATVSWEELSSAVAASGSGSLSAAAAAAAARDAGAVPPAAPDSSSGEACLTARLEAAKSLDATAFGSLPRILRTTRRSSTGASPIRFRAQRSAASNTCISGLRLARGSSVSSSREMSAANSCEVGGQDGVVGQWGAGDAGAGTRALGHRMKATAVARRGGKARQYGDGTWAGAGDSQRPAAPEPTPAL